MIETPDPLSRVRVVLVRPQHPGNIGAAARAMMTMGLTELVLVEPERYDPLTGHPQARAQSSGALGILEAARVVPGLEHAIADCVWVVGASARPRHLGDEPMTPWDFAHKAVPLALTAPIAIVFGPERTGLDNADLERCHATAMIPANPQYSSLNLAQAVQVFCYELRKAALPDVPSVALKRQHPVYAPPPAEDVERFYAHLQQVLLHTGFLDPKHPTPQMRRLRQLFNRALPDRNELAMLRGILSSVEKPKRRSGGSVGHGTQDAEDESREDGRGEA